MCQLSVMPNAGLTSSGLKKRLGMIDYPEDVFNDVMTITLRQ
jgi:hypothetical protein